MTKDEIESCLRSLEVSRGDVVFFHSSLKSIGQVEGGPDAVIDAFLETVGESGTLVLPALCMYDWEKLGREGVEKAWDIRTTPAYVGLIPETFRKRPGVIRSDNPTHSVTAFGRDAFEITKDHRIARGGEWAANRPIWASTGAFGDNSPWDRLCRLDARYMLIGVDFNSCTLLHHVQAVHLERDQRKKDAHAPWPEFDFRWMGGKLEETGIVRTGMIGNARTRLMRCRELVDAALDVLREVG
ncbi:MAG TPA: AAC(3) family N-acetyltransferase [Candidatus Brocadiia bacterium]|nr:AAC(3) family N-acetyltransferase [Candidatus Brocadiia bacterium]